MARTSAALIVVCLTVFLCVHYGQSKVVDKRDVKTLSWNEFVDQFCQENNILKPTGICNAFTTTTTTTTSTTTTSTTEEDSDEKPETTSTTTTTEQTSSTTELSGSALEHAHWCQFRNGSYLALGQTFIYNQCSLCQCIKSRAIMCTNLQCMATYCLDGSSPYVQEGRCCQQCGYDNVSTASACMISGVAFPHGTLLRRTNDNVQCWCQMGAVECRRSSSGAIISSDVWGNGTTAYVVVIIIIAVLLFGVLLCCAGGFWYYYYYNKNEQAVQEAYAQYYNNAGWQPMSEDGQVIADEKQAEAQAQQYAAEYPTGQSADYTPPPYAFYNGSYTNQENLNEQKSA